MSDSALASDSVTVSDFSSQSQGTNQTIQLTDEHWDGNEWSAPEDALSVSEPSNGSDDSNEIGWGLCSCGCTRLWHEVMLSSNNELASMLRRFDRETNLSDNTNQGNNVEQDNSAEQHNLATRPDVTEQDIPITGEQAEPMDEDEMESKFHRGVLQSLRSDPVPPPEELTFEEALHRTVSSLYENHNWDGLGEGLPSLTLALPLAPAEVDPDPIMFCELYPRHFNGEQHNAPLSIREHVGDILELRTLLFTFLNTGSPEIFFRANQRKMGELTESLLLRYSDLLFARCERARLANQHLYYAVELIHGIVRYDEDLEIPEAQQRFIAWPVALERMQTELAEQQLHGVDRHVMRLAMATMSVTDAVRLQMKVADWCLGVLWHIDMFFSVFMMRDDALIVYFRACNERRDECAYVPWVPVYTAIINFDEPIW